MELNVVDGCTIRLPFPMQSTRDCRCRTAKKRNRNNGERHVSHRER